MDDLGEAGRLESQRHCRFTLPDFMQLHFHPLASCTCNWHQIFDDSRDLGTHKLTHSFCQISSLLHSHSCIQFVLSNLVASTFLVSSCSSLAQYRRYLDGTNDINPFGDTPTANPSFFHKISSSSCFTKSSRCCHLCSCYRRIDERHGLVDQASCQHDAADGYGLDLSDLYYYFVYTVYTQVI